MKRGIIIFIVLIVLLSGLFGYVGPGMMDEKVRMQLIRVVLLLLIPTVIVFQSSVPGSPLIKATIVLMILQFISMFGALVLHNQSLTDSFIVTCYALVFLLFPLMYILELDERALIRLCFVLGIWSVFISFVQQFTWPNYLFGALGETEEGEANMRNGVIRYGLTGRGMSLLMLLYSFQKYLDEGKSKYLICMIIGLVGTYLSCTRQVMVGTVGCLLVGLYLKGKMKVWTFAGILFVGLVIYHYSDVLFSEYAEMTEEQMNSDEEYIRFVAYRFYGVEYNKGEPLAFLVGNGLPRQDHSAYGDEMLNYRENFGLYQSDIGLVGEYSLHGIFYVLVILYIFYYVFKMRKYISLYLQLYMLFAAVTSVMLMPFRGDAGTWETIMVLYLIDMEITRNKKIEYIINNQLNALQRDGAGV